MTKKQKKIWSLNLPFKSAVDENVATCYIFLLLNYKQKRKNSTFVYRSGDSIKGSVPQPQNLPSTLTKQKKVPMTKINNGSNSVLFSARTAVEAYNLASIFLDGTKGRIAGDDYVAEARSRLGFDHDVWKYNITTNSTEWFGLDRLYQPCMAILYNAGPLKEREMLEKYIKLPGANHNFNVVPRQMFLDILSEKYGSVDVVYFSQALREYNENKNEDKRLSKAQIESSALTAKRLGGGYCANEYARVHVAGSVADRLKNKNFLGDIKTCFLESDCRTYLPFATYLEEEKRYISSLKKSPIDFQSNAIAHFIAVSNKREGFGGNLTNSSVGPALANSSFNFLAITNEHWVILGDKLPRYEAGSYLKRLPDLFLSTPEDFEHLGLFFQIVKFDGWPFTVRLSGEPEFLVNTGSVLGRRTVKCPNNPKIKGYDYGLIRDTFKGPANSFRVVKEFKPQGKYFVGVVDYFAAEVYYERYIPTENAIVKNRKLFSKII